MYLGAWGGWKWVGMTSLGCAADPQEYADALKIVKVEADPCPNLVEKYKVLPVLLLAGGQHFVSGHCASADLVSPVMMSLQSWRCVPNNR